MAPRLVEALPRLARRNNAGPQNLQFLLNPRVYVEVDRSLLLPKGGLPSGGTCLS
jgi:hypothetical protein